MCQVMIEVLRREQSLATEEREVDSRISTIDAMVSSLQLRAPYWLHRMQPELDAPIDQPELDAPIDRLELDAPIDRMELDAPIDQAELDAPIDQLELDAPIDQLQPELDAP